MANYYGTQATKRQNAPSSLRAQGYDGGVVKSSYDSFTLTADLSAADIIHLGRIPEGARVIDAFCYWADLDGSGGTIDVGWSAGKQGSSAPLGAEAADPDGFFNDLDVATAGEARLAAATHRLNAGFQKVFTDEVDVTVTIGGDTDATTGTLAVEVFYVID